MQHFINEASRLKSRGDQALSIVAPKQSPFILEINLHRVRVQNVSFLSGLQLLLIFKVTFSDRCS